MDININTVINYILFSLPDIAVPIFLVINGYLLITKEFDLKKHIKKTIKMFLIIIIWGFIYTVSIHLLNGQELTLGKIVKTILQTASTNSYTAPLWFLQYLIIVYLLYPILKLVYDKEHILYKYLLYIVIFFSVGINMIRLVDFLIGYTIGKNFILEYICGFLNVMNPFGFTTYLLYFMLGTELHKYNISKNKGYIILISGIVIRLIRTFLFVYLLMNNTNTIIYRLNTYEFLSTCFIIIGLYAVTMNYKNKNTLIHKLIETIGKNTMGIYLCHWLIVRLVQTYIVTISPEIFSNVVVNILADISILIISLLVTLGIKKIPILRKIII